MTVKLAPNPRQQYVNSSGVPYSGAKLFYYAAGTTTKQNTYTTSVGDVANTNPIILDSAGRTPYGVWLTEGYDYKVVLAPANDTDPPSSPIFTEDVLSGINDNSDATNQWASSGVTPTYVNATQFTVPGDKTSTFLVDRRVKVAVTAGTLYGYISASAYTSLTTVTVVMDSGTLDSGLTMVDVGILTDLSGAIPNTITRNSTAQTLTNKSLSDSTTFIVDNLDATKKFQIQASGITAATTRTMTVPDKDFTPATVAANTFTGAQTLSGASVIDANATLAAHATTAAVWLLGNYVTLTGGATVFTDVADAPQAGAEVELYCNAAHTFTNNANLVVDGGIDFVAEVGDRVLLRAQSTSVFTAHPIKKSGRPIIPIAGVMDRRTITTTDTVGAADVGKLIEITSGTFTLAFAPTATLTDQSTGYIYNSGAGDVTLDPSGAETIDGLASFVMYGGEIRKWYVEGTTIKTLVIHPFYRKATSTFSFVMPPGYVEIEADLVGAGGGGGAGRRGQASVNRTGGAPGGAPGRAIRRLRNIAAGSSITVTIGAAGTGAIAQTVNDSDGADGTAGGNTTFDALVTAYGGAAGKGGSALSTATSGSGSLSAGGSTNTGSAVVGGSPSNLTALGGTTSGFQCNVGEGGGGVTSTIGVIAGNTVYGGASSGHITTSSTTIPVIGSSMFGVPAGGTGGHITNSDTLPVKAADAGSTGSYANGGGALGGNCGAAPTVGANGVAAATDDVVGTSGGGGGSTITAGQTGKAGGNGGAPGGAGGGGGASLNGLNSGAGGNGADGRAIIKGVL